VNASRVDCGGETRDYRKNEDSIYGFRFKHKTGFRIIEEVMIGVRDRTSASSAIHTDR
jgi:hypothetical protein